MKTQPYKFVVTIHSSKKRKELALLLKSFMKGHRMTVEHLPSTEEELELSRQCCDYLMKVRNLAVDQAMIGKMKFDEVDALSEKASAEATKRMNKVFNQ